MTTIKSAIFSIAIALPAISNAQPKSDALIENLLRNGNALVRHVAQYPDSFRLQIIYTQIDRDRKNTPTFKNYYYRVDREAYFNPASTVKLPLAALALEKITAMHRSDITRDSPLQIDSTYDGQTNVRYDSSSKNLYPSVAHYIKKALLVSDNDAYNRLYQFIGQGPINDSLLKKGYSNTKITREFTGFSEEQNRHTNQFRFLKDNKVIYTQPPQFNPKPFVFDRVLKFGTAHIDKNGNLVNEPIDFTKANVLPLEDLQQILQNIMFPEAATASHRFHLSVDDYAFLYKYLSQYPSETDYPKYDTSDYYDSYVKFYFRGSRQVAPYIRVFNKVGWAYGFLIDVSYVVDFKNRVEFMLTTSVYTNRDGVLNDDKYDYENVGWPFMHELGQLIYQHEIKRDRKFKPDLTRFQIKYDKRDPGDKRPSMKNIDN